MDAPSLSLLLLAALLQDSSNVPLPPEADRGEAARALEVPKDPASEGPRRPESPASLPRPADLPGLGGVAFWTLVVLAAIAGTFLLLRRWLRRTQFLGAETVRILARKPLGPRQQVFLLEVGPKVFVVGSTRERLSTLGEFSVSEEVAAVRAASPVYEADSAERAFRESLSEGMREQQNPPALGPAYGSLFDELREIRKKVVSWKA